MTKRLNDETAETETQSGAAPQPTLLVGRHGSARILTLNRPQALNAIDDGLVEAINAALDEAAADPRCTAVALTAVGKSFSAGADLKSARARSTCADGGAASAAFVRSVGALTDRLEAFPRPVIAAVQGLALAGGLELVLACDLVIAAEGARFGDAHANYGLLPGGGGSVRLPRKIGATRAKYLMFSGEFLPAAQVQPWGLVNEVVADAELLPALHRLLDRLATKSPIGLQRMKQLVDRGLELPHAEAMALEQRVFAEHALSHDRTEGLAAFAQRRPPRFLGR